MSARLNFNEIPYFSWKGKTFNQITSNIQKNQNSTILTKYNLYLAPPLKIYRKEIVSTPITTCSRRNISIDEINMPNGYILSTIKQNGMLETIDFNLTSNSTDRPGLCNALSSNGVCLSPAKNALNRVRSSGNLKKVYSSYRNNDTYYTSSKQYLESRNRLFAQNQYNYIRKGNLASTPGDPLSYGNEYSAQGLNHCPDFSIVNELTFQYQWCNGYLFVSPDPTNPTLVDYSRDSTPTLVTIPPGYYKTIDDINQILINTMLANQHYYVNTVTNTFVYLLAISYDNLAQKVVLQTFSTYQFDNGYYMPALPGNTIPPTNQFQSAGPYFIINEGTSNLFGIPANYYPNTITNISVPPSTSRDTVPWVTSDPAQWYGIIPVTSDIGTIKPQIAGPIYVPLYYKPNNYQYANQGAVSSSSKITRLKYNTITTNALKFRTTLGNATGNALAYNTNGSTYTLKDKMGFPNKCTPVFNKYSDKMKICGITTIVHEI